MVKIAKAKKGVRIVAEDQNRIVKNVFVTDPGRVRVTFMDGTFIFCPLSAEFPTW
jgi:hypothetical protein